MKIGYWEAVVNAPIICKISVAIIVVIFLIGLVTFLLGRRRINAGQRVHPPKLFSKLLYACVAIVIINWCYGCVRPTDDEWTYRIADFAISMTIGLSTLVIGTLLLWEVTFCDKKS